MDRRNLIERLDGVFSKWIRLSHADDNGYCTCITCKKKEYWKDVDAGHYIDRKHMATRWMVENVYPQCRVCNRLEYGSIEAYEKALGASLVDYLTQQKHRVKKYSAADIKAKIEYYNKLIKQYGY